MMRTSSGRIPDTRAPGVSSSSRTASPWLGRIARIGLADHTLTGSWDGKGSIGIGSERGTPRTDLDGTPCPPGRSGRSPTQPCATTLRAVQSKWLAPVASTAVVWRIPCGYAGPLTHSESVAS
jgi:hypothetical protein